MTNKWVAIVSVLLLSGTVAVADDWAGKMKTVDTDGSGTVSRNEWNTNAPKLNLGAATPEFTALDKNNNNSVSEKEWASADKIASAYGKSCKSADSSWCRARATPISLSVNNGTVDTVLLGYPLRSSAVFDPNDYLETRRATSGFRATWQRRFFAVAVV